MTLVDLLFGTQLIEILQGLLAPKFSGIFEAVTLLGNDAVLVGLTAIVYWCFDKRSGRLVTYVLFLSAYLNFFLKILIPSPRPPANLRIIEKNEAGYGFPSGNAQDATTFWTWIGLNFKKRIVTVLGSLIVVAVGISRIYLGVHYPGQVIGGWIIGFTVAAVGAIVARRHLPKSNGVRIFPQMIFAFATLIPLAFAVIRGAVGETNPGQVGGYLFAFALGVIAEDRYVRFKTDIAKVRKVVRIVVGGGTVGLLVIALGPILPMTSLAPAFMNSFIRGLAVVLIVPAAFKLIERI